MHDGILPRDLGTEKGILGIECDFLEKGFHQCNKFSIFHFFLMENVFSVFAMIAAVKRFFVRRRQDDKSFRFENSEDFGQQLFRILQVLDGFERDHTVECSVGKRKGISIAADERNVVGNVFFCCLIDGFLADIHANDLACG